MHAQEVRQADDADLVTLVCASLTGLMVSLILLATGVAQVTQEVPRLAGEDAGQSSARAGRPQR